jgi:ELWxxDGT repeat protein
MRRLTLLLLLFIAPLALRAQAPYLVKDINATTAFNPGSSAPNNFFRFGSRVFFAAVAVGSGSELWSTDGTEAGTVLVADINPASFSSSPSRFAVVNGKLLFNARDSRTGEELWTSDGTAAGTRLLADIKTGPASSAPGDRIIYHDRMIFAADDGVDGNELWITDGTPAGTRFFKDLVPGADSSDPHGFVLFNGLIYFACGNGLWKSDGTDAGTVPVKTGPYVSDVVVAGSRLFFTGSTDEAALWVSDGTEAGTRMVSEINPGQRFSIFGNTAFGDRLLFIGIDSHHGAELWISDGTAAGTHIVRDVNPGASYGVSSRPVVSNRGLAFFGASIDGQGQGLWKSDGTENGTVLVRGIPGLNPTSLVSAGDIVYFVAASGAYPTLWRSDGTYAGTTPVQSKDAVALAVGAALTLIDNIVYFAGANGLNGYEPWKSDGTEAGTSMIRNLARDAAPSSTPFNLIAAGDWIYFTAWDGSGQTSFGNDGPRATWRSDGTPEGTVRITGLIGDSYRTAGHSLYFNTSNVLWTSNGTPEGTAPAAFPNNFPKSAFVAFVNGDTLFLTAYDGNGYQLYAANQRTNAAPESLGVPTSYMTGFADQAGRTIFFANNGLWSSDGTRAGTYAIVTTIADGVTATGSMGGSVYYATQGSGATGAKLWRNDGTFESTSLIKALPASASLFTTAERNLFFISGNQLWVTDGTEGGTRAVTTGLNVSTMAAAGSRVVFPIDDPAAGRELWVSDGTVAGTHLLRDIYPGAFGSFPTDVTSVRGAAYFSATDDLHGDEIWTTDGTPEGTKLAADVEPGPVSSLPHQYVQAGDRLFFTATTAATGNELWALPLPSAPRLTVNDIRIAEGDSGTSMARFTVTLSTPSTQSVTVDYATSDGTALAGSDYDAASGTLTFAAGETSKTIDVRIRGDVNAESNETLFLTLANPVGATLQKGSAFAIIDDDDQFADLGLSLDFSSFSFRDVVVNGTNNGPRAATNIRIAHTATPVDSSSQCNFTCSAPQQLLAGATARVFDYRGFGFQQYLTATATIRERDTQPSNNSVGWITNGYVAADALFLTPGAQANVWFYSTNISSANITSSEPSVISVPGALTFTANQPASFVARGVGPGTATIRVFTTTFEVGTLKIDVVPSGTKPRWPGAISAYAAGSSFDSATGFSITTDATAPYSGEKPTGVVIVSANGHEITRVTLDPNVSQQKVTNYLPDVGDNLVRFDYSGDANFLPMSLTQTVTETTGHATILGGAERIGTAARVHVRVTGSPAAAPTGTVTVSEPGVITAKTVTLSAGAPGEAQADINLTNVSAAPHTFVIMYSGDSRYSSSIQNVRVTDARLRAVKH